MDDATRRASGRISRLLMVAIVLGLTGSVAAASVAVAHGIAAVVWLCCVVLCFASGTALALGWRWSGDPGWAWLATAAIAAGFWAVAISFPSMLVGRMPTGAADPVVVPLLMGAMWVLLRRAAAHHRFPYRLSPVQVGLFLGAGGLLVRTLAPGLPRQVDAVTLQRVLDLVTVILGIACLWCLWRLRALSRRDRHWVLTAGLLAFLGGIVGTSAIPILASGVRAELLRVELFVTCGSAFVFVAAGLLWGRAVPLLVRTFPRSSAGEADSALLAEQRDDKLHEVRASLAGLYSAVHLLTGEQESLTFAGRARLGGMLESEIERLQRLVDCPGVGRVEALPLTDVLAPLVSTRRATGQDVRCEVRDRAGEVASPDVVREVLNILLVNAATHAPGAVVVLTVEPLQGAVRVRVTDNGPGIPRELTSKLFCRGVRRPDSPGSGIGLELARRLARGHGGDLWLEPSQAGTSFTLLMPGVPKKACA